MVVVLGWLSRKGHRPDEWKKYEPLDSEGSSWESGPQRSSTPPEFFAACRRIQHVKHVVIMKLGALRCKQYHSSGEEAAALVKEIHQQDSLLKDIIEHSATLTVASTRGCDLSADVRFWLDHKELLQHVPEEMRPGMSSAGVKRCQESTERSYSGAGNAMTSLRKRDHMQILTPSF